MRDVIVIGGGPAGLTAGIYLCRAGYKPLILEKETIGGKIASSPLVENYPGFSQISGSELADKLYDQVTNLGADIEIETVTKIENGKIKKVITEDNVYECKTIIIATGAKNKLLGLPNEQNFLGKGIHFCTSCDGAFYKDKTVAVIGGANSAAINALYMSELSKKVYIICLSEKLECEKVLEEKIKSIPNIQILYETCITNFKGEDELEGIVVETNGTQNEIALDGIFESIGMDAQTEVGREIIHTDENKYFNSEDCVTNEEGIFVAGDCRSKKVRQLTTAINDGTIAAVEVINYLQKNN